MLKLNNSYIYFLILILIAIFPVGLLIGTGVSNLINILIVIFYCLHLIVNKDFKIIKNFYFKLLIILTAYIIFNYLWSVNYYTIEDNFRSFGFIRFILLIFAFELFLKKKNLYRVLLFWTFISCIVIFDIFYEYLNHENIFGFKSNYDGRIASFLNEELKIANFVLGFSFLSISFLLTRKLSKKSNIYLFFCYSLLILTVTSIIITGERSNAIRAIFIFTFLIILSDNKLFKYKYLITTIFILSAILTYNAAPIKFKYKDQTIKPIIEKGLIKTFKDSQYGAHYVTSIEIFKSYPLLGIGNKNFRNECQKEKYFRNDYLLSNLRCATHPHQIYLEFLSEHGLIGTIIILGIMFFILYKNIKIYRKKKNLIHLSSILFVLQTFLPIIPSGSFFTSWTGTIFWINFAFMIFLSNDSKIFYKK